MKEIEELTDDEKYLIVRYMGYIIKSNIDEPKHIIKIAENIVKKLKWMDGNI